MKCLAAIEGCKEAESCLFVPDLPAYETDSHCGVHLRCLILITCLLDLIPGPHGCFFVLAISVCFCVLKHFFDPCGLLEVLGDARLHTASKITQETSNCAEVRLKRTKQG